MVVFSLFLLIMMLIVAGMGVDLVRSEHARTRLQTTLDRAVLAAASLNQDADPEAVVRDYFRTAGLQDSLRSVEVTQGFHERTVSARAELDVGTIFLPLVGIDTLPAPAVGTAREAELELEIMLVLDVSGSMQSQSRLANLKIAASEFVATMIENSAPGTVSIGIVPFNGQVNLGPQLISLYNVSDVTVQANDDCVDLSDDVYARQIIPVNAAMSATGYADTFSTTSMGSGYSTSNRAPTVSNMWCPPSTANRVMLPSADVARLQAHIRGLTAVGATSINAGMRWGTTLVDPGFRPEYTTLIGLGAIESSLLGHPYDYRLPNAQKIIVVMTDGSHFPEERVAPQYKSGASQIYRSNADGNYSIYNPSVTGANKYWVPHLGTWQNWPWGMPTLTGTYTPPTDPTNPSFLLANGATRQKWPDIWSTMRMSWVSWQFYARAMATLGQSATATYNAQMIEFRRIGSVNAMNTQLQTICRQARRDGITVFGIAFEAPPEGQEQISLCAGSPSNYYDANGLEIQDAFRSIAGRIQALRLTQ